MNSLLAQSDFGKKPFIPFEIDTHILPEAEIIKSSYPSPLTSPIEIESSPLSPL
jgi:hypothetical protein